MLDGETVGIFAGPLQPSSSPHKVIVRVARMADPLPNQTTVRGSLPEIFTIGHWFNHLWNG
jgi:hypothetical protein